MPHWISIEGKSQGSGDGTYTSFVRGLARGREPTAEEIEAVLRALRASLVGALRKRGMWHCPPSCLGITGHVTWTGMTNDGPLLGDALGELVSDCYVYVFVQRLPRLIAQLSLKPNIDGLVFLNVKHFLFETQRRTDPIGYRIFQVLRTTTRRMTADGTLRVIHGARDIRNDSVLATTTSDGEVAARSVLQRAAEPWADTLLPDLITAQGRAVRTIVDRTVERMRSLIDAGTDCFRMGTLNDVLRVAVRQRWRARATAGLDERAFDDRGRPVLVTAVIEEAATDPNALIGHVAHEIDGLGTDPRTSRYLRTLLTYLAAYASDQVVDADGEPLQSLPSYRRLSTALGIPRERLPGLFQKLQQLATVPGQAVVPTESMAGYAP